MQHRTLWGLILLTSLVTPVQASSLATARLGAWTIDTIDLAPEDGRPAQLTWTSGVTVAAYAYSGYGGDNSFLSGVAPEISFEFTDPFAVFEATSALGSVTASATITGDPSSPHGSVVSSWERQLTIDPWTRVTVSVPLIATAVTTVGSNYIVYEYALAIGTVVLRLGNGSETVVSSRSLWAGAEFDHLGPHGQSIAFDGVLNISFDNASDQGRPGLLLFSVQAGGETLLPSPVPEPATWGLWLVGIACAAAARRARCSGFLHDRGVLPA